MRTFVDTNIWVYAVDATEPRKQRMARASVSASPPSIVVSPQVMGELYVTLTRKGRIGMDATAARGVVEQLGRFHVTIIEARDVLHALDVAASGQIAYWDALIVAAARAARCDRILSEDFAHGTAVDGIRIENPFEQAGRGLAEARVEYEPASARTWDDAALRSALVNYEAAGREAGMRPNAIHAYWDYARRFLDWRIGGYRPRGVPGTGRPVPIDPVTADALAQQAAAYADAIRAAGRGQVTVDTYHRHAMFFVRWLRGEFEPGGRLGAADRYRQGAASAAGGPSSTLGTYSSS